jgi:chromate transporter
MTILTMFGLLFSKFIDPNDPPFWLVGLPPAAISLVFKAFYGFGLRLDTLGILLALFSALVAILVNNDARIESSASQWVFPSTLALGGFITFIDHKRKKPWGVYSTRGAGVQDPHLAETIKRIGIPLWAGALIFATWVGVLVLVVVLGGPTNVDNVYLDIFGTMYRVGSIIFGGGQVVIPMLQDELVPKWVSNDQFLQGLGLAQSLPGPLFNSSAYYGAIYKGLPGALLAFLGLFSPGVLLVFAVVRNERTGNSSRTTIVS